MYLRGMVSIALLTREGEVALARRIEDAEHRVLKAVLRAPVAVNEILEIGNQLRKAKIRVTEVTRDADDQDPDFDEEWHTNRVCKALDNIGRLFRKHQKLLETAPKRPTAAIKSRYKELVKRHHPDANGGDRGSEDRFRDVLQAYRVLKQAGLC